MSLFDGFNGWVAAGLAVLALCVIGMLGMAWWAIDRVHLDALSIPQAIIIAAVIHGVLTSRSDS